MHLAGWNDADIDDTGERAGIESSDDLPADSLSTTESTGPDHGVSGGVMGMDARLPAQLVPASTTLPLTCTLTVTVGVSLLLGASPTPQLARMALLRLDGPNCDKFTPRGQSRTPLNCWSVSIWAVDGDGQSVMSVLHVSFRIWTG